MSETIIAWTDYTFNPWMGCTKVSPGCAHCYAETLTRDRMGLDVWGVKGARKVTKTPWANIKRQERLARDGVPGVLGPGKPRLIFTGSLMDWAEDRRELVEPRARMWETIRQCPHLHFQLLTKRANLIREFLPGDWNQGYPNVWLGVSIEDNRQAWRADDLAQIPARVRFISYEPALGPVDEMSLEGIHWLIVGGESGPDFRPMDLSWVRDIRKRCEAEGVAFFFKQSAAYRTEQGIELDGEIVRNYPELKRHHWIAVGDTGGIEAPSFLSL